MHALLLLLALTPAPEAGADELLLLVPWELLAESRTPGGEVKLETSVRLEGAGRISVAGEAGWRDRGAPSWLPVLPLRVRRQDDGSVATFDVICEPDAGQVDVDSDGDCGRLRIRLPGLDAAAASRVLARLTLTPGEDPVADVEPHVAAILEGRLGRGPLGLAPRFQAWLLWLLRPREGWPRIALDTTTAEPTLRVDLKLAEAADYPRTCWAERLIGTRMLPLLDALGGAAAEHGYALAVDLHLLVPPAQGSSSERERRRRRPPPDSLAFPDPGDDFLGGLWSGGPVWDELRLRLDAETLGRWSEGGLAAGPLRRSLVLSWNGEPLRPPAPGLCP